MPVELNFGQAKSELVTLAKRVAMAMAGMTLMLRLLLLSLFQNASAVGGLGKIQVGAG